MNTADAETPNAPAATLSRGGTVSGRRMTPSAYPVGRRRQPEAIFEIRYRCSARFVVRSAAAR